MKKIGLVVSVVALAMFLSSFAYAASDEVAAPKKMDGGVGGGVSGNLGIPNKKLAVDPHGILPPGLAKRDVLPPGLEKRDVLPHGLAKRDGGLDTTGISNEVEAINRAIDTGLGKLSEATLNDELFKNWHNERPKFDITSEAGIDGYRQDIKNWLASSPLDLSDLIKEIDKIDVSS